MAAALAIIRQHLTARRLVYLIPLLEFLVYSGSLVPGHAHLRTSGSNLSYIHGVR